MRQPSKNIALLEIFEEHADPLVTETQARGLHRELTERHVPAEPSYGSSLAVVVASGPAVAALVECVFAWLSAGPGRTVQVGRGPARIELPGPSPEHRQRLIEWLMDHIEPPGPESTGGSREELA
ncbi:hypothetical protein [Actinomadura sp. 9N407]|uniref:effector-associated constant component EACC1 n=1 Tax=Actinomadura sp. 9N407 TaxID=3375154 RepID=UPI0037BC3971